MLPKSHILFGIISSLILFLFFNISLINILIFFLASILIDMDHYFFYVNRKKELSLKKAFKWHVSLPKKHKPLMHIFHSIEFLLLIFFLSFLNKTFLFIFLGLIFHSILDMIEFAVERKWGVRESSLIKYLISDKNKYF